jgi:predicted ATPase/DNA-binding XRE family transcriptional regulator
MWRNGQFYRRETDAELCRSDHGAYLHPVSPDRLASFPALLRELRRAAGLTQEELAQGARVGVRTLRDLETGRAMRPQRSTVDLLAAALGLDDEDRERFVAAARGQSGRRRSSGGGYVNLGTPPELLGRDSAIRAVADLLDVARLVTLVGLAGIGKSVLSLAIGHRVAERCPGGVAGVVVADASTQAELLGAVAATFRANRIDALPERLAGGPALLVMDAVDRNRPAALSALLTLRRLVPDLRVLATSRHPLKLPDEHEWPVPPLDVPPPAATGEKVFSYPATALFLDRLRRVRDRPVDDSEAATLGALVRRLGGVPLALELAAARGRVLDLPELLRRCDESGTGEPAGQTLRDAVLASVALLTPDDRACLHHLSAFQWRWSVSLAEDLLAGELAERVGGDVVGLIDRLVAVGVVTVRPSDGDLRFWLLDPVRTVVLELAGDAVERARDRHALIIAELVNRTVMEFDGPAADEAATLLDRLGADLYAALDHLRDQKDGRAEGLATDVQRWRLLRGVG